MPDKSKAPNCIDIVKLFCCMMIVGLHLDPLISNGDADYCLRQSVFRIAIPFFLISTGYFFAGMEPEKRSSYLKRLYILYAVASVIYIPLYIHDGLIYVLANFILAYHHLWYLLTVAICIQIMIGLDKIEFRHKYWLILLLPAAIFLYGYCKLLGIEGLSVLSDKMISLRIITYITALPFLLIGDYIRKKDIRCKNSNCIILFFILTVACVGEAVFLRFKTDIAPEYGIFNWMPAIPLFLFAVSNSSIISSSSSRTLRKLLDIVYVIHVWILELSERFLHLSLLPEYFISLIVSFAVSAAILAILSLIKRSGIELPKITKARTG